MSYLDNIQTFIRVYELGSLSAAGRDLRISPAVASARLSQLEDYLGVRLFQRTTRSLTPTEHGQDYYKSALIIMESVAEAEDRIRNMTQNLKGTLYIAAPLGIGKRLIAPEIPNFLENYPDMHMRLRLSDRKVEIATEGLDLAFFLGQPEDSNLRMRKIADVERVLCAAPDYIEKHGNPMDEEDLRQSHHEFLNFSYPGSKELCWSLVTKNGIEKLPIKGRYECDDGDVLTNWALDGRGIALKPLFEVGEYLASGALVRVAPQSPPTPIQLACLFTHKRQQDPKTRLFLEHMVKTLPEQISQYQEILD